MVHMQLKAMLAGLALVAVTGCGPKEEPTPSPSPSETPMTPSDEAAANAAKEALRGDGLSPTPTDQPSDPGSDEGKIATAIRDEVRKVPDIVSAVTDEPTARAAVRALQKVNSAITKLDADLTKLGAQRKAAAYAGVAADIATAQGKIAQQGSDLMMRDEKLFEQISKELDAMPSVGQ